MSNLSELDTCVNQVMDRENVTMSYSSDEKDRKKYLTFQQRLLTFENWLLTSVIPPSKLASAGFHYLQCKDMVECQYCKGVFMNWKPGDDPESEHKLYFPHCDFLKKRKEKKERNKREKDDTEKKNEVVKSENKNLSGLSRNLLKDMPPKYPQYTLYENRLQTFTNWPERKQTPEMLAEAGFYYIGKGDYVRCFYCGGGLSKWKQEDDIWKEHALWFSFCGFVNFVKGSQFIKHCVDNRASDSVIADIAQDMMLEPSAKVISNTSSQPTDLSTSSRKNKIETELYTALINRVKETLNRRQKLGEPYMHIEQFIEDVLSNQTVENNTKLDSNSLELIHLLNQLIIQTTDKSTNISKSAEDPLLKVQRKAENEAERNGLESKEKKEMDNKSNIKFLEEENRKLKEDRLCKICMDRALAVVFLPCRHLATCFNCAPILTNCPMCRQWIRGCIRIFFS